VTFQRDSERAQITLTHNTVHKSVNLDELDTIRLNQGTVEDILGWCRENPWAYSLLNPPIEEGVIEFIDGYVNPSLSKRNAVVVYFDCTPEYVQFVFTPDDPTRMMWVATNDVHLSEDGEPNFVLGFLEDNVSKTYESLALNITGIWCSKMSYIREYRESPTQVQTKQQRVAHKKKPKKGSNKKRVTYINKRVWSLSVPADIPKRENDRIREEAWGVRGFWRKSKLGKVSWVRPHTRGGKGKAKPKQYEVKTHTKGE